MVQVGVSRSIQGPWFTFGALRGSLLGLSVIGYLWGQWQEKGNIAGDRLHPQEAKDELATPSAVPSSPKVKTGPLQILHPFSFQGQSLPPWPSSIEALRPQWFQLGEGLSLSWASSSGPQTGFPTLTRAGTSPHGSLPPTPPCSSSSLHPGMLRGGYPGYLLSLACPGCGPF